MKGTWDRGLFVYWGSPPGNSGWAVFPGFAWMAAWMLEEPSWFRAKAEVHERVHWPQELPYMLVGWLLAFGGTTWIGWPGGWWNLLAGLVAFVLGTAPWMVRYALSPSFRLAVECEAEAAEKNYLHGISRWEPTADAVEAYVSSHLETYYGRWPLFGDAPDRGAVRMRFVRELRRAGVDVPAGAIR